jgi:hypothetical protein
VSEGICEAYELSIFADHFPTFWPMAASDHTPRATSITMANNFGIGIGAFIGPFTVCHHFHYFLLFYGPFQI